MYDISNIVSREEELREMLGELFTRTRDQYLETWAKSMVLMEKGDFIRIVVEVNGKVVRFTTLTRGKFRHRG